MKDLKHDDSLNTQRLRSLLSRQQPNKYGARYVNCGEQVDEQSDYECDCKTSNWSSAKHEQEQRRDDRSYVCIDDRDESARESLFHCRRNGLAGPQVFPDSFKY